MANASTRYQLTDRDYEILLSLDRCPLTARQLLKLSEVLQSRAFRSVRSVQDRLQKLRAAGWVSRWRYATTGPGGAPEYYKPTLLAYRFLHNPGASPPRKRAFGEIGVARHHHTHALSEFIVHTLVAAERRGIRMKNFYPENSLRLAVHDEALFPDCAFELIDPSGQQYNFLVELDNGTERVRSERDADSWQRKIRLYDELQNHSYPHRFRVLVVTTRSRDRLQHILDTAAATTKNCRRSLFYGMHLEDYLAQHDAVCNTSFRDHRGNLVALVPPGNRLVRRHVSCPNS